jgi:hypothetical protein
MQQEVIRILEKRTQQLERRLRTFQWTALFAIMVIGAYAVAKLPLAYADAPPGAQILRTRGIIIEDEKGRERILLGAPIPLVEGRKRKDATTALLFLNENGTDRVVVGFSPDPQIKGLVAKRVAPSSGIQINDDNGNERGGFGYLDNGRVSLGLDWKDREGVSLTIDDQAGHAAVMLGGETGGYERVGLFVGRDGTSLVKVAHPGGMEALIMKVTGDAAPELLQVNQQDRTVKNVLESLGK